MRCSLRTHRSDVLHEVLLEFDRMSDETDRIQEVELKVLPLPTRRFKYIVEVALKLLSEPRNPKTTILGMMLSYSNNDES